MGYQAIPCFVTLIVEVPEGIKFINPLGMNARPMKGMRSKNISVDGKRYIKYEIPKANRMVYLFASSSWPAGKTGTIYYYAKWDGSKQPKQTLTVKSIHIEKAPTPKRLISNLGWMPARIHTLWPNFYSDMVANCSLPSQKKTSFSL